MAERLTESEVSKSFTEQELRTSEQARIYQKLGELEDILEKYGIESVEELENIFKIHHTFDTEISWVPKRTKNYELMIQIMLEDEKGRDYEVLLEKILSHTKKQLDTWKRACEFLANKYAEEYFDGRDIEHCFNADKRDKFVKEKIEYFYQQAKKEGNDE